MKLRFKLNKRNSVRDLALAMSIITVTSTIISYAAGTDYYKNTLGTNKALGSPLANSEFSEDDWNKWEMAVFGIFMGNYVKLGEEDYTTAFAAGSDGLEAMQFAAGGDANSNGTLRKMLNICMTAQKANYKSLQTRYRYTHVGILTNLDLGKRQAKFKDLFPMIEGAEATSSTGGDDQFKIKASVLIEQPDVRAQLSKDKLTYDHEGKNFYGADNANHFTASTQFTAVYNALLPDILLNINGKEKKLFSLNDGYDVQIMQAVLAKMGEDTVNKLFEENPELVMDAFGNICALSGGKPLVIIPAAANKNINRDNKVNMLNGLLVNGMLVGSNETKMVSNAYAGYLESDGKFELGKAKTLSFHGMPAVSGDSEVQEGKVIAYSDTEPLLYKDYYRLLGDNEGAEEEVRRLEQESGFPLLTGGNASEPTTDPNAGTTDPNAGTTDPNAGTTDPNAGTTDPNAGTTDPNGTEIQGDATDTQEAGVNTSVKDLKIKVSDLQFGKYLNDVLDKNSLYRAPFKIEATGVDVTSIIDFNLIKDDKVKDEYLGAQMTLSMIGNINPFSIPEGSLDSMLMVNGGANTNSVELFSGHYYLTPMVTAIKNQMVGTRFFKDFANYSFKALDGSISAMEDPAEMRNLIQGLTDPAEMFLALTCNSTMEFREQLPNADISSIRVGSLIKTFGTTRFKVEADEYSQLMENKNIGLGIVGNTHERLASFFRDNNMKPEIKKIYGDYSEAFGGNGQGVPATMRLCKVYAPSNVFEAVSKIYDLDNTALFKQYTTNIYITYLDWYGILDDKADSELVLDTSVFDGQDYLNIDGDELIDAMTEEEKQKMIQNNMVKLLSTDESGREYRGELADGLIVDLFEKWYDSLVDGDSLGFLNISGYKDNPMTSFVFENWEFISTVMFGVMFVLLIMIAIIKRRSLAWLLVTEICTLSAALAIPAYVELVPYVCNNVVQKAFHENAMFWLASEQVNNAAQFENMQSDSSLYNGMNMSDQEVKEAMVLMSSIRLQQSDQTLLVKLDTSKKVIDQISVGWDKLQQKASTRWLVPSLIQQLSADNDSYDYVYITTYDWLANMTRGYLASLPVTSEEKDSNGNVTTVNSLNANTTYQSASAILESSFGNGEFQGVESGTDTSFNSVKDLASKQSLFPNYIDTSAPGSTSAETYKSTTRMVDDNIDKIHTRVYFMLNESLKFKDLSTLGDPAEGMQEADWDALANNPTSGVGGDFQTAFTEYNESLLSTLNSYNRYDANVNTKFANLWCTEGPGLYFYSLVKDIFPIESTSVEYIAHQLAGGVATTEVDGKVVEQVRTSFMHMGTTGYTRDILDLEELFTNAIPYLYAEQLVAGGSNGENGLLGDSTLDGDYDIYKDNLNSWLYRSNWVTKLMDDNVYKGEGKLRYIGADGKKVSGTCSSMIDPRTYPRPMIFSEAQQKEADLSDGDLTLLELKLVRLNEEVCNAWTELINYANIKDMTPEIMERLMTTIAVTKFNDIVTRANPLNSTMSLYPREIDLRNVSWDALLRHMLVSSTNNSEYLSTKNIIRAIWGGSGALASIMTFITSIFNSAVIPFFRDILLMLMFVLVILSVLMNTLKSWNDKLKAQSGWLLTYALFAAYTALFYYLMAHIIGTSNSSKILDTGELVSISSASVTFKMLLIIGLDVLYTFGLYKYFRNIVFRGGLAGLKAYMQDGGFSFFYDCASGVTSGMHHGFSGLTNSVGRIGGIIGSSGNRKETVAVENKKGTKLNANVDGKVSNTPAKRDANSIKDTYGNDVNDTSFILDDLAKESLDQVKRNKEALNKMVEKGKSKPSKNDAVENK